MCLDSVSFTDVREPHVLCVFELSVRCTQTPGVDGHLALNEKFPFGLLCNLGVPFRLTKPGGHTPQ
jgi:hypothetical protein